MVNLDDALIERVDTRGSVNLEAVRQYNDAFDFYRTIAQENAMRSHSADPISTDDLVCEWRALETLVAAREALYAALAPPVREDR
jgi:hypothetical protein